ncbi:DNA polymerase III subunit epsilon [Octadecabacter sp. 1_MG-2023]|uniref:DNA polymerase III subunit epsilon n=1 Tax=unclassified Octadecabacter TaxID=196158 RepID=UPI001C09FE19|nr:MULTISPECIES: DNA polymerase III subunit epsilon [unclassified Octadecabacter]MBU2992317.1 DNA polymerase III subunit epsilon [Octadecabacter sp. B2R22]MDO6734926.1 DNA polymerase III subunit epsilon [Octadecabacter sp. 1_MG-2023]
MREIVLDTETTGFEPGEGDRLVEIGAVELFNHMPTGRTYHQYINPKRDMPAGAFEIHGIGPDLLSPPQDPKPGQVILKDKPVFADVAQAFLDFIGDSILVIHNAAFDMKFLNAELGWLNRPPLPMDQSLDTLAIARKKFPGSPASLDALCRRFGIDNSNRALHGALLDSEILAEVYLELIGGRQPDLVPTSQDTTKTKTTASSNWRPSPRPTPLAPKINAAEAEAHAAFIEKLGEDALWKKS